MSFLQGSVDGTFRTVSRIFKQLFILMLHYKGTNLCVAYGLLPDKNFISYYIFNFLVLQAFRKHESAILELSGRRTIKLQKIRLDFELGIHRAFEGCFRLEGCYFHFRYVLFRSKLLDIYHFQGFVKRRGILF